MVCRKNVNDLEYDQLVQLIKVKYAESPLVFLVAFRHQLVKLQWKGLIDDSGPANNPNPNPS